MNKDLLILDADDVAFDFKNPAYRGLKKDFNIQVPADEWYSHDLEKILNLSNEKIIESFYNNKVLEESKINDGLKELVDEANRNNVSVVCLTARGWHPKGKEITEKAFLGADINIENVIAIPLHESKGDVIKTLQIEHRILGFADDHPRHVTEVFERSDIKVENVFVVDQSCNYNFSLKGVTRVFNLYEILDYLF